jgi:hypothetical protein
MNEKTLIECMDEVEALVALVRTPSDHIAFRKICEREAYKFARHTLPQIAEHLRTTLAPLPSVESARPSANEHLTGAREAAKNFLAGLARLLRRSLARIGGTP